MPIGLTHLVMNITRMQYTNIYCKLKFDFCINDCNKTNAVDMFHGNAQNTP